jgi:hypothetical protein
VVLRAGVVFGERGVQLVARDKVHLTALSRDDGAVVRLLHTERDELAERLARAQVVLALLARAEPGCAVLKGVKRRCA